MLAVGHALLASVRLSALMQVFLANAAVLALAPVLLVARLASAGEATMKWPRSR